MGKNNIKHSRLKAEIIADEIVSNLKGIKKYKICGSIRRKSESVGDIDIVVVIKNRSVFEDIVHNIADKVLIMGNRNVRFIYKNIQIDILIVDQEYFEAAILHFTGSKLFNIKCRMKAREMGFILNEYGLWNTKGVIIENTEIGIISKLEIDKKYLDPTKR